MCYLLLNKTSAVQIPEAKYLNLWTEINFYIPEIFYCLKIYSSVSEEIKISYRMHEMNLKEYIVIA